MPPLVSIDAIGVSGESRFPVLEPPGRNHAGIVGPMFEQRSFLLKQFRKGLGAIRLEASVEDQVVGSFEHVDGIDLDEPESLDQDLDGRRSRPGRGRLRQPLGGEQDPSTLPRGDHARMTSDGRHRGRLLETLAAVTFGGLRPGIPDSGVRSGDLIDSGGPPEGGGPIMPDSPRISQPAVLDSRLRPISIRLRRA